MSVISKENITKSNQLSDTEKIVVCQMLKWEEFFKAQGREDEDVFICTNEGGLIELNAHELFKAINHLVDLEILKRRECDAVAYEWRNRNLLTELL